MGKKIKGRGGESKATQFHTPLINTHRCNWQTSVLADYAMVRLQYKKS